MSAECEEIVVAKDAVSRDFFSQSQHVGPDSCERNFSPTVWHTNDAPASSCRRARQFAQRLPIELTVAVERHRVEYTQTGRRHVVRQDGCELLLERSGIEAASRLCCYKPRQT